MNERERPRCLFCGHKIYADSTASSPNSLTRLMLRCANLIDPKSAHVSHYRRCSGFFIIIANRWMWYGNRWCMPYATQWNIWTGVEWFDFGHIILLLHSRPVGKLCDFRLELSGFIAFSNQSLEKRSHLTKIAKRMDESETVVFFPRMQADLGYNCFGIGHKSAVIMVNRNRILSFHFYDSLFLSFFPLFLSLNRSEGEAGEHG